jgi:glycerophosphoryl diester phosphodiesterase
MRAIKESWKATQVIGHRGAAAHFAENTVESFQQAVLAGVAGVECDVRISLDGELVVVHDATLDRTTPLTGRVDQTNWDEMRAVGVPSLAEYLAVTKGRAISVIEAKDGEQVVARILDLFRSERMLEETVLFSFDENHVREAYGQVFTVRLSGTRPVLSGCDGIGVAYQAIDGELVKEAHAKGLPVFAWTVPPGPEVERLRDLKVNFIITNHPREVLSQLA